MGEIVTLSNLLKNVVDDYGLSGSELEALKLALNGQTTSKIAQSLGISSDAVRKRLGEVYKKFGITGKGPGKLSKLQQRLISNYSSVLPVHERPPIESLTLEVPSGQVNIDSEFYVERPPIEEKCYEAILRPGALIRIKAPHQMGKTSLMARILACAEEEGYKKALLDFQLADEAIFKELDTFLQWFCASITSELGMEDRLDEYWQPRIGCKMSCTNYFERYLLKELSTPIVLGLDELDLIFQYKAVASDFFGLLRAWHEKSKSRDNWKKLRLVLVHSTEIYVPLDLNQSPFNVGLPIELPDFTEEQVLDLAKRHGMNWSYEDVRTLMKMVGGHPYLIRNALYYIAQTNMNLDSVLKEAWTESGIYADHLRRHLWNLSKQPELLASMREIVQTKGSIRLNPIYAFQLHSMGLVNLEGNDVVVRCALYRNYFRDNFMNDKEE